MKLGLDTSKLSLSLLTLPLLPCALLARIQPPIRSNCTSSSLLLYFKLSPGMLRSSLASLLAFMMRSFISLVAAAPALLCTVLRWLLRGSVLLCSSCCQLAFCIIAIVV